MCKSIGEVFVNVNVHNTFLGLEVYVAQADLEHTIVLPQTPD